MEVFVHCMGLVHQSTNNSIYKMWFYKANLPAFCVHNTCTILIVHIGRSGSQKYLNPDVLHTERDPSSWEFHFHEGIILGCAPYSIPGWCLSSCLAYCGGGAVRTTTPCWSYSPSMAIASSSPSHIASGEREGERELPLGPELNHVTA